MKKILTIIGTRPEIIRLSRIIPILDATNKNILVHTGQNYDYELDKIFFKDLKLRKPKYYLGAKGSFGEQISTITKKLEKIIIREKPDKFLVLGDTNSSLGSIIAKRLGVRVYHLEAGNRSFIKNSPEEINRKIIDHVSDINLPYTYRSCDNLVKEGIPRRKIFVIGNPIYEVINFYKHKIKHSNIIKKLEIKNNDYAICTMHRQENVDDKEKFRIYIKWLNKIVSELGIKIIFPIHPRTKKKIKEFNFKLSKKIIITKPLGFIDFLNLEINSKFFITDSGTVQEEAVILKKKCLIFRESTERPETIESGNSIIINQDFNEINKIKNMVYNNLDSEEIPEYKIKNVSQIVCNIINSDLNL